MSLTQELYLAILAMDAYNQGEEPGLAGIGDDIGIAHRVKTRDDLTVGFSATEYEWDGKTVISYRGTDDDSFPTTRGCT